MRLQCTSDQPTCFCPFRSDVRILVYQLLNLIGGISKDIGDLDSAFQNHIQLAGSPRLLEQKRTGSKYDKNEYATIIKPTQTRIYRKNYVKCSLNSEGYLKKLKSQGRCLFRPISNQGRRLFRPISFYLCHQKPNPARETVPLKPTIFHFYFINDTN